MVILQIFRLPLLNLMAWSQLALLYIKGEGEAGYLTRDILDGSDFLVWS